MSDSDGEYGPALPPGLGKSAASGSSSSDDDAYGPAIPKAPQTAERSIGPQLPSHLTKNTPYTSDSEPDSDDSSDKHIIGPALPAGVGKHKERKQSESGGTIGPVLPGNSGHRGAAGPSLPAGYGGSRDNSDSDDDYEIGPSVNLQADGSNQSAAREIEMRAQRMKEKLEGKDKVEDEGPKKRESWMTELPDNIGVKFGVENRQFRKNAAPEQDSSWTETPQEREKREREGGSKKRKRDREEYVPTEADLKAAKEIEAYNKKNRPKSLLEMHQKEMKKKKKKEKKKNKGKEEVKVRRPFDREADLQVNRLDDAQRRAIIKRSQDLGSRFKSGGTGTTFL